MKKEIVLLLRDVRLADALLQGLRTKENGLYEYSVFTNAEELASYMDDRQGFLLIFERAAATVETEQLDFEKRAVFSSVRGNGIYLYQSLSALAEQILAAAAEEQAAVPGSVTEAAVFMILTPEFCSVERIFARLVYHIFSKEGSAAFLNLDPFPETEVNRGATGPNNGLSDLIFGQLTGKEDIGTAPGEIPGVRLPEDLYHTEPEVFVKIAEGILKKAPDQKLVIYGGGDLRTSEALLPLTDVVLIPLRGGRFSEKRIAAFRAFVNRHAGDKKIRVLPVLLPSPSYGKEDPERLLLGPFGEQTVEAIKEYLP